MELALRQRQNTSMPFQLKWGSLLRQLMKGVMGCKPGFGKNKVVVGEKGSECVKLVRVMVTVRLRSGSQGRKARQEGQTGYFLSLICSDNDQK